MRRNEITTSVSVAASIGMLMVAGCGKDQSSVQQPKEETAPAPVIEAKGEQSEAAAQVDLGGLRLGMSFDECRTILTNEYGADMIGHTDGDKRLTVLTCQVYPGDVLQSCESTWEPRRAPRRGNGREIQLPSIVTGTYKPQSYRNGGGKDDRTGMVCMFSESETGLIASLIYRRTNAFGDEGTPSDEVKKQLNAKYGSPDATIGDQSLWMLKPMPATAFKTIDRFFLSISNSDFERALIRRRKTTVRLGHTGKAKSWLMYEIYDNAGVADIIQACLVDLDLIIEGVRLDNDKRHKDAEREKEEKLKKAQEIFNKR
jgi:hypothetical protein